VPSVNASSRKFLSFFSDDLLIAGATILVPVPQNFTQRYSVCTLKRRFFKQHRHTHETPSDIQRLLVGEVVAVDS
jgi:hypothetical protein